MDRGHLDAQDFLKYLDAEDDSEEYAVWMESVQEHLEQCEDCQRALRKALLADGLDSDEGLKEGLQILSEEQKIRRKLLEKYLLAYREDQRIGQLAKAIREGYVWNRPVYKSELLRPAGGVRGETAGLHALCYYSEQGSGEIREKGSAENRGILSYVSWTDGVIRVELMGRISGNRMVVLSPETGSDVRPFCGEAVYDPDAQMAVVEFPAEKLPERYRLYLDTEEQPWVWS